MRTIEIGDFSATARTAAAAVAGDPGTGVATLVFDVRQTGDSRCAGPAGITLRDSSGGAEIGMNYRAAGWFIHDAGSQYSWFADVFQYDVKDPQTFTLTLDYDGGTFSAVGRCANPVYGANKTAASGALNLPAGFVTDTIITWSAGHTEYSVVTDNIVYETIPAWPAIGLVALGAAIALSRMVGHSAAASTIDG
jgi:hypothetical protein